MGRGSPSGRGSTTPPGARAESCRCDARREGMHGAYAAHAPKSTGGGRFSEPFRGRPRALAARRHQARMPRASPRGARAGPTAAGTALRARPRRGRDRLALSVGPLGCGGDRRPDRPRVARLTGRRRDPGPSAHRGPPPGRAARDAARPRPGTRRVGRPGLRGDPRRRRRGRRPRGGAGGACPQAARSLLRGRRDGPDRRGAPCRRGCRRRLRRRARARPGRSSERPWRAACRSFRAPTPRPRRTSHGARARRSSSCSRARRSAPAHVREMRGPLPEIETIVTGGVDATNAAAFLAAGAVAVGIGSAILRASPDRAARHRRGGAPGDAACRPGPGCTRMTDRLAGHVCLVTGSTGIAEAAAIRLAAEGATHLRHLADRRVTAQALADADPRRRAVGSAARSADLDRRGAGRRGRRRLRRGVRADRWPALGRRRQRPALRRRSDPRADRARHGIARSSSTCAARRWSTARSSAGCSAQDADAAGDARVDRPRVERPGHPSRAGALRDPRLRGGEGRDRRPRRGHGRDVCAGPGSGSTSSLPGLTDTPMAARAAADPATVAFARAQAAAGAAVRRAGRRRGGGRLPPGGRVPGRDRPGPRGRRRLVVVTVAPDRPAAT